MVLLKITGHSSELTLRLEQPLRLSAGAKLALDGIYTDNNIANLVNDSKIYFWGMQPTADDETLVVKKGYWTLKSLEAECRRFFKSSSFVVDANQFIMTKVDGKVSITSPVRFYFDPTLSKLLGFAYLQGFTRTVENYFYEANVPVAAKYKSSLRPVDVIEVHCNLVVPSFSKHDEYAHRHVETGLIYQFSPDVPHGNKISEKPSERLYVPLRENIRYINHITVSITDQSSQPLLNKNSAYTIYLDLLEASPPPGASLR